MNKDESLSEDDEQVQISMELEDEFLISILRCQE